MNLDMTLREFFELADRVGGAAQTIRDAQRMLGGTNIAPGAFAPLPAEEMDRRMAYAYEHRVPAPIHGPPSGPLPGIAPNGVLMTNKGPATLTPDEQAQKERLRMQREQREAELMPDNIKAAMQS